MMLAALYSWSVKDWSAHTIERLPQFGAWLPPVWFGGLHEVLLGARDPFLEDMAQRAWTATAIATLLALSTYLISYRRYRRLMLESPSALEGPRMRQWSILRLLARTPRREAIMHFMAKTLVRSRAHRVIWMAYIGFAIAVVVNSSIIDGRLLTRHSQKGLQFLVLFWPLASSVILMNGFRHVISIPAEIKANWIFRVTESLGRKEWMSAVERFIVAYAIAPIYIILVPVAVYATGWRLALLMTVLQVLCSLFIFEVMFSSWQQLPFACSYFPGKRPMIAIVSSYIVILGIVVPIVSFMIAAAARVPFLFPFYFADFLFLWIWVRRMRREGWGEAILLYEDQPGMMHDLGIKEMTYGGVERSGRSAAGDAGHADSQDADPRSDARIRSGGVHPSDLGRRAAGGGGGTLPGPASFGVARSSGIGMGSVGEQSPREVLQADSRRPASTGRGSGALDSYVGGHLAHHAAGLILRLRALFKRRRLDRDLDDEMQFHIAMREQKYRAEGMSPHEARNAARRQFGSSTHIREMCRDLWTFVWMETFWQDIRYGLRQLRRSPGFTSVAAVTLALGVGGTTALFSMFDTVLWRPMSGPDLKSIVVVAQALPGQPHFFGPASAADLEDIRAAATSFDGLALFQNSTHDLVDAGGDPFRVESAEVAPNFFQVAQAQPVLGRTFVAGEERVVLLSDDLWRSRFGGSRAIIGTTIRIDGLNTAVIGVMPPGFTLPRINRKLWLPLKATLGDRASLSAMAMGRLKYGRTVRQAASELDGIAARLQQAYSETNRDRRFVAWTYQRFLIGDYVPIFEALLLGAAIFVLLLACANVASLQFARATGRWREVALRTALGAGRSRIVRQLVTESLVLGIGGSIVGLLVAHWGLAALKSGIPAEMRTYMPGWREIGLNFRALGFALACAVASGLVVGLAPAWHCSRADLTESLKEGGRGGGSSRVRTRLRSALVAAELAAAVVLVMGAGLMVRGFHSLVEGGARFQPDGLLTLRVSLNQNRYSTPSMLAAFYRDARDRVAVLPGVRSAFVVSAVPFSRTSDAVPFIVEGSTQKPSPVQLRAVSADYFRALNVPLLSGSTSLEATRAAVISQSMAQRWSLEPGRRIQLRPPDGPRFVIAGIVGDVQQTILSGDPTPTIYMSYEQFPRREMDIGIRTSGDALRLATAARAAVRAVDREQPITNVSTLAGLIYQEAFVFAYMAALMGIFGLVALGLSAIGVYGVMSYVVGQQQHEIGVRMALGAQRATVLAMLLRRGMRTAVVGLMLGLVPAYGLARLMRSAIWGVTLHDPALFIAIPLSLLAAAALAIYIPARRGTRIDPLQALRGE